MKAMQVCRICSEPISSPISQDAVAHSIARWLPGRLQEGFRNFNCSLREWMESYYSRELPARAKETLICSFCYVKEAYAWLKGVDRIAAESLLNVFSFGFSRATMRGDMEISPPMETYETSNEFGICDECGEYSSELIYSGGEWLCVDCEKFE